MVPSSLRARSHPEHGFGATRTPNRKLGYGESSLIRPASAQQATHARPPRTFPRSLESTRLSHQRGGGSSPAASRRSLRLRRRGPSPVALSLPLASVDRVFSPLLAVPHRSSSVWCGVLLEGAADVPTSAQRGRVGTGSRHRLASTRGALASGPHVTSAAGSLHHLGGSTARFAEAI